MDFGSIKRSGNATYGGSAAKRRRAAVLQGSDGDALASSPSPSPVKATARYAKRTSPTPSKLVTPRRSKGQAAESPLDRRISQAPSAQLHLVAAATTRTPSTASRGKAAPPTAKPVLPTRITRAAVAEKHAGSNTLDVQTDSVVESPPKPKPSWTLNQVSPTKASAAQSTAAAATRATALDVAALFDIDEPSASTTPARALLSSSKASSVAARMAKRRATAPAHSPAHMQSQSLESELASLRSASPEAQAGPSTLRARKAGGATYGSYSQPAEAMRTPEPEPQGSASQPLTPRGGGGKSASLNGTPKTQRILGVSAPTVAGARRTYGGMRSFLAEPDEALLEPVLPEEADAGPSSAKPWLRRANTTAGVGGAGRESYAELKRQWAESEDEDEPQNLRSITHLRSAGETQRFADELEYLLSGLDATHTLSVRRDSALEVLQRIIGDAASSPGSSDVESSQPVHAAAPSGFFRSLRAAGSLGLVWDALRNAGAGQAEDEALDVALGLFLARVASAQGMAETLMRDRGQDVWCALGTLMRAARRGREARKDGLWRVNALGEKGKSLDSLRQLDKLAVQAGAMSSRASRSLRSLLLATLCSLTSLRPRPGFAPLASIAQGEGDEWLLSLVLSELQVEAGYASERLVAFGKGMNILPPATVSSAAPTSAAPDVAFVDLSVHLLELCTAEGATLCADAAVATLSVDLVALLRLLEVLAVGQGAGEVVARKPTLASTAGTDSAIVALCGTLKLLLNLTDGSEPWATALLSAPGALLTLVRLIVVPKRAPDAPQRDAAALTDAIALSIGLLTNTLEHHSLMAQAALRELSFSLACKRRACAVACACERRWRRPALEHLARLFAEQRKAIAATSAAHLRHASQQADEASQANAAFLGSCLAVAIALALSDHKRTLDPVLAGLQTHGQGLASLVEALEEFALVNAALRQAAGEADEEVPQHESANETLVGELAKKVREIMGAKAQ